MPPELIAGILGPVIGSVIGILGFTSRRNTALTDSKLETISENVEIISHQVTNLQIQLPTKYVSKEEMMTHITSEETFHRDISNQLRELRDEVISLRANQGHH